MHWRACVCTSRGCGCTRVRTWYRAADASPAENQGEEAWGPWRRAVCRRAGVYELSDGNAHRSRVCVHVCVYPFAHALSHEPLPESTCRRSSYQPHPKAMIFAPPPAPPLAQWSMHPHLLDGLCPSLLLDAFVCACVPPARCIRVRLSPTCSMHSCALISHLLDASVCTCLSPARCMRVRLCPT